MTEPKTIRLKLNADFAEMGSKGDVIIVPVSRTGKLKNRYWRRRASEAALDGCVEILVDATTKTTTTRKTSKKVTPETVEGVTDAN